MLLGIVALAYTVESARDALAGSDRTMTCCNSYLHLVGTASNQSLANWRLRCQHHVLQRRRCCWQAQSRGRGEWWRECLAGCALHSIASTGGSLVRVLHAVHLRLPQIQSEGATTALLEVG